MAGAGVLGHPGARVKPEKRGDTFIAYADGSALKTGKGGWGVVVYVGGKEVAFNGHAPVATCNTMELTAVISALGALPEDAVGVIRTDSNYVVQGVNTWRAGWEKKGWKTAAKKDVANKELWIELLALKDARPKVRLQWVKGHASDPGNIKVDAIALAAAKTGILIK